MKSYHVILTSLTHPFRDLYQNDVEHPETKEYHFDIDARSEEHAYQLAKEQHPYSVWESSIYEN